MTQRIEPERSPEVWEPPELVARLTVGTRVRWRISAECGYRCGGCGEDFHYRGPHGEGVIVGLAVDQKRVGHFQGTGGCGARTSMQGHFYGVVVNPDAPDDKRGFWASASELQPLGPEPGEEQA